MDTIKLEIELLQSLAWPGLIKFLSVHETASTLSLVVGMLVSCEFSSLPFLPSFCDSVFL
jgi:hypothetical protein